MAGRRLIAGNVHMYSIELVRGYTGNTADE